jgi:hypothetical protein
MIPSRSGRCGDEGRATFGVASGMMFGCHALGHAWAYPMLRKHDGAMQWFQRCSRCHDERPAQAFISPDSSHDDPWPEAAARAEREYAEFMRSEREGTGRARSERDGSDRSPVRPDYPA